MLSSAKQLKHKPTRSAGTFLGRGGGSSTTRDQTLHFFLRVTYTIRHPQGVGRPEREAGVGIGVAVRQP
jgi:hypothetical protein